MNQSLYCPLGAGEEEENHVSFCEKETVPCKIAAAIYHFAETSEAHHASDICLDNRHWLDDKRALYLLTWDVTHSILVPLQFINVLKRLERIMRPIFVWIIDFGSTIKERYICSPHHASDICLDNRLWLDDKRALYLLTTLLTHPSAAAIYQCAETSGAHHAAIFAHVGRYSLHPSAAAIYHCAETSGAHHASDICLDNRLWLDDKRALYLLTWDVTHSILVPLQFIIVLKRLERIMRPIFSAIFAHVGRYSLHPSAAAIYHCAETSGAHHASDICLDNRLWLDDKRALYLLTWDVTHSILVPLQFIIVLERLERIMRLIFVWTIDFGLTIKERYICSRGRLLTPS
ncbi:hypothetical protein J6590_007757 [Homalodisca vitripennis]|nr:hypothetical protein J6590_007757 [Homalodisca vitripennis]